MANLASTNETDLSYIEETTAGTTPATPTFQRIPTTGGTLTGGRTTAVSEQIRTDRQKTDLIVVDQDVTGDIQYEMSYNAYKPLLQAMLQGRTVTGDVTGSDITITASTRTITSPTVNVSAVPAGSYIRVKGASNNANNGLFRVDSSSATEIVLNAQDAGNLVDAVAGDTIEIDWNHTPNGTETPKTYTFKKEINATPNAYMYYRGVVLDTATLSFETGSILSGSISVMGRTDEVTNTQIAGSTTTAIPSDSLMNSTDALAFTSTGLGDLSVDTASLTINNSTQGAKAIGTLGAVDHRSFSLEVTGDLTIYFETIAAYDLFHSNNSFALSFKFTDDSGNNYVVFMPRCKFTNLDTPVSGRDEFLHLNCSYEALRDETLDFTVGLNLIDA